MKNQRFYLSLLIALLLTSAMLYGQQTGHWQAVKTTNKLTGRSECGLAAVGDKLYLIGGDGSPATVEEFDPATATWTAKSTAPMTIHHFQPVSQGGKIYVLGAFVSGNFPVQLPMATVYSYDPQADTWTKGPEIPVERRRASGGAAAYNGKLYIVNGIQYGHTSGTTNMFDEYDPATGRWTILPDAPHIRDHSMAAVVGDKLYAVGGRNTSYHEPDNFMAFMRKTVLEVDCYDFQTGTWSTLPAKLPMGSGGGTLVALDGKLYYMGGERATATTPNGPQKETYSLDPAHPTQWVQMESLNNARNGVGGTALNHKIYVAGGSGGGPGGPPPGANGIPPGPPPSAATMPPINRGDIALEVFVPNK